MCGRQRQAADLARAAIQDVKKYSLAFFYTHWLAVAEHSSIDGEGVVTTLYPFGIPLASDAFMALSPASFRAFTLAEGERKSMSISPPRLKVG